MSISTTSTIAPSIPQLYRTFYRTVLQAVRYSSPARYQARDILRNAFRTPSPASTAAAATALKSHTSSENKSITNQAVTTLPSLKRIERTLEFLHRASETNGAEHHILRNILKVRYWRYAPGQQQTRAASYRGTSTSTRGDGGSGGSRSGGPRRAGKRVIKSLAVNQNTDVGVELRRGLWTQFDACVVLLNESEGLCLRT